MFFDGSADMTESKVLFCSKSALSVTSDEIHPTVTKKVVWQKVVVKKSLIRRFLRSKSNFNQKMFWSYPEQVNPNWPRVEPQTGTRHSVAIIFSNVTYIFPIRAFVVPRCTATKTNPFLLNFFRMRLNYNLRCFKWTTLTVAPPRGYYQEHIKREAVLRLTVFKPTPSLSWGTHTFIVLSLPQMLCVM